MFNLHSELKDLTLLLVVSVGVERKLKWIISKTVKTNSRLFKTPLILFQSCFNTINETLRQLKDY